MRVFVTGLGAISGIGQTVEENMIALANGKHGMGKVTLFSTALCVPVSEVKQTNRELKEKLGLEPKKTYSRTALLGMLAAREALTDSQIKTTRYRVGFISSTSVGGMDLSENFYIPFREDHRKGQLHDVTSHDCGDSTKQIAAYLGITDFSTTISTACSSAANAIMLGARLIKSGYLDVAIAGGTDALCRFTMNGFNSLLILDKEHCRPFDQTRAGLNLGEGAGYLVLQSGETLSRNPYCELTGYANINEAYHQTGSSPEGDGPYRSMLEAINVSGILPEQIDYINVHGTGTPNNDLSEGIALKRLFGENIPPFSSVKAFIGHTLGASEGIEAVYSVLSVQKGIMYPNLNFQTPVEETGLIPVTTYKEGTQIRHVLSNSFGFGGSNSSLLFSKSNLKDNPVRIQTNPVSSPLKRVGIRPSGAYINSLSSIHPNHPDTFGPDYKELIKNPALRRRMSRIVKMGVACGLECIGGTATKDIHAIITATGLGCLEDTEKFMNNLLDNNEQLLNPTPFIQSTFNTVGAQIALICRNQAYNVTYVHRGLSFESALLDGLLRLSEGDQNVLVGAFDEITPTSYTLHRRMGLLKGTMAGEGTQFFLLSNEKTGNSLAHIAVPQTFTRLKHIDMIVNYLNDNGLSPDDIKLLICGNNGNTIYDAPYQTLKTKLFPHAACEIFKDMCGEYQTSTAFAVRQTVRKLHKNKNIKHALVYNHYYNADHSLILISQP